MMMTKMVVTMNRTDDFIDDDTDNDNDNDDLDHNSLYLRMLSVSCLARQCQDIIWFIISNAGFFIIIFFPSRSWNLLRPRWSIGIFEAAKRPTL